MSKENTKILSKENKENTKISYSEDYAEAVSSCEFWRSSLIENVFDLDISDPIKLQEKAKQKVSDDKLKKSV